MLLDTAQVKLYRPEIERINKELFGLGPSGANHFGIIEGSVLQAFAQLKCICGHWGLRSCYVKPEFRGRGLQRQLIRERLEYAAAHTDVVRVTCRPDNPYSKHNIESEGFVFERMKRLPNGLELLVYKRRLN